LRFVRSGVSETLFEELVTPILYVVPDDPRIEKVVIKSLYTEPQIVRRERSG